MKVTRDVIYDLLPTYFAGDASEDTRALIDAFFASDPEFGRMAERFRTLLIERPAKGDATEAERAKVVFSRTRTRVKLRWAAGVWALGAGFALVMAVITTVNGRFGVHPGTVIAAVFGAMALLMLLMSLSSNPEKWYASFTGAGQGDSSKPGA
jgi:hypothetical protein